jgi:geranylgeranyl diphosphate synthase type II
MKPMTRIEQALATAIASGESAECPPKLAGAIRHAVFPGGARIRPQLCLAVAQACGDDDPALSEAAASAIELLHCASLVHDDLPCFDDSPTRRGRASVHYAFGESLAVLAGDALIVLAFQTLAVHAGQSPQRLAPLLATISRGVGMPCGIVAGQAWECEPRVSLAD